MTLEEQHKRYHTDPKFHQIVDVFTQLILDGITNVHEIGDAYNYAVNKVMMETNIWRIPKQSEYESLTRKET